MRWHRGLLILFLLAVASTGLAADAEERAFDAARKAYEDGFHSRAELEFSNFVARLPQSPRLPSALLWQAQAALAQKKFGPATEILTTNMGRAGAVADQFQYWLGQVHFQSGRFDAAAAAFATLAREFTNSSLRLDAAFGEAQARFELKEWTQVDQLLASTGSVFQAATASRGTNDPLIVRGWLLLAEAGLARQQFQTVTNALARVPDVGVMPDLRWLRQYLLTRALLASGEMEAALNASTNLITAAATAARADLRATSVALQADILHALNRPAAAARAYEANLADTVPPERRRDAFVKSVELLLAQERLPDAIAMLQRFLTEQPNAAASDVALLTLGEIRLRQHQLGTNMPIVPGAPTTNLLELALGDFSKLIRDFPQSVYVPRAQLSRGWALLAQQRAAESLAAFQAAADTLPFSAAQAVARFKVADLQFQARQLSNAITNYRRVAGEYSALPQVQRELVPRALHQMLQAGITAQDFATASEAIEKVLALNPVSPFADRSLLLYGQALPDQELSRKVFAEFANLVPQSPLLSEVKLALARTYEKEGNWTAAVAEYERWIARFPTNDSLPRAEYFRALATFQSGNDTNALTLFTNYVRRFVTSPFAANAQRWIGDYYFNRGKLGLGENADDDFREAERNYQLLFVERTISTNWPVTHLTFEGRLKAGRAAFHRQSWDDATAYFTNLINMAGCPDPIRVEAVMAFGDTVLARPSSDPADKFSRALRIFSLIPRDWPADVNVPRAWGRMADCHWNLAGLDSAVADARAKAYADAYELYARIVSTPSADISARSQAEVNMGNIRRRQAEAATGPASSDLLDAALNHYLNVVYGTNLDPAREEPDAMWVRIAAIEAAGVAEAQRKWDRAIDLYSRLQALLPALRGNIERRLIYAREQQALQKP